MKLPLYQVDAFTSRLFGGNPAAVVLLDEWLPVETMAAVAAENNLAETAYVIPRTDVSPLRWFTPTLEIDLCGHATLATADVLFRHVFPSLDRLTFSTQKSGKLIVTRNGEMLTLDFPAKPGQRVDVTEAVTRALGVRACEAYRARDLMVVVGSAAEVRALEPDMRLLAALDDFAVMVTAPGDGDVDFVSRFFAPKAGVDEDPVTGSAHCTMTPYWATRLGKTTLTAKQLSPRGGDLLCELRGDRVLMSGRAVEYLRGEIDVVT
jgi:PhzF family phenazine biosynthesis protein